MSCILCHRRCHCIDRQTVTFDIGRVKIHPAPLSFTERRFGAVLATTCGNGAHSYRQPFRLQVGEGFARLGQHGIGAGELLPVVIAPAENEAVLGPDDLGPHGGARRNKALGDGHGMQRAVQDSLVS
jgi:hypothetical protein